jgi:hypothetical protein
MKHLVHGLVLAVAALASGAVLVSCGGGSGPAAAGSSTLSGASAGAMSSGTVTAFGSVFVNGHEFATGAARVLDDDAGTSSSDSSALEVGMSVDVMASSRSSERSPEAAEIHLHPLARGVVDAIDSTASTLTLLGQTVQLSAATNYSDHRACVTASTSPCAAVDGASALHATSGTGVTQVPGSYVTVHGFLFDDGTPGSAQIVATLVVVDDAPASGAASAVNFKVEGVVDAVGTSSVTIGGLSVDLSSASCRSGGATVACAGAFAVKQIVSAVASAAPSLPATTLVASTARLRSKLVVETVGASVELEGKVASVNTAAASFVLRGLSVNTAGLTGLSLPGVGDQVRVLGSVASGGASISATAVTVLHVARSAIVGLEGDAGVISASTSANTWVLPLLGQTLNVGATTRLADRSQHVRGGSGKSVANPFNISTFKTYLDASVSRHLIVRSQADATTGALTAISITIVPASTSAAIAGVVDATPAPVLSSAAGVPTTFAIHGLAIRADAASIVMHRVSLAGSSLAAGDFVLARGSFAAGALTVGTPLSSTNGVVDFGLLNERERDRDCF